MKKIVAFLTMVMVFVIMSSTVAFAMSNTSSNMQDVVEDAGKIYTYNGRQYIKTPNGSFKPVHSQEYIDHMNDEVDSIDIVTDSMEKNLDNMDKTRIKNEIMGYIGGGVRVLLFFAIIIGAYIFMRHLNKKSSKEKIDTTEAPKTEENTKVSSKEANA